jgi:hypothetical protein
MKTSGHYYFHEEQNFRRLAIIVPLILLMLVTFFIQIYGMYKQIYLHNPWGDKPLSDQGLIITSVCVIVGVLLVVLLILNMTLITEVRFDGFYYRFPILIHKLRIIKKEDISRYEVGKYRPIWEYGGWGIRTGRQKGKAFNVWGNQGVKIYLKSGKMILFGTQNPEELRKAMERMMNT